MKKVIALVLCLVTVLTMLSVTAFAADTYYPAYTGNSVSIVDALKAVTKDAAQATYAHRARIAAANGIVDYKGTADQNTQMLALLRAGKLKYVAVPAAVTPVAKDGCYKPYTGSSVSIVEALKAVASASHATYAHRARIAAANGIVNYKGTADQNTQMLALLRAGNLKYVALPTATTTTTTTPTVTGTYAAYKGTSGSIMEALKSLGVDASYAHRARIAAVNGITGYKGTSAQNTLMLGLLISGQLKSCD